MTLRLLGDLPKAKKHFEKSLAKDPKNSFALRGYAKILLQLKDLAGAKWYFEKALEIEPRDNETRASNKSG